MKRRWLWGVGFIVLVVLLLGAAGWRDVRGVRAQLDGARDELTSVFDDPATLRDDKGRAEARTSLANGIRGLQSAETRIRGSLSLRVASWIPGVATQRQGAIDLTQDARRAAETTSALLMRVDILGDRTTVLDGALPVDGLSQLGSAARSSGASLKGIHRDTRGLWGALAAARQDLNMVTRTTGQRLVDSADSLEAARSFMGATRFRTYFVAIQNNAEMRDQGMVLAFAVIRFENGRLTVQRSGPITELPLDRPVDAPLAPSTSLFFGPQQPLKLWQNVNASADWPASAEIMAAMYRQKTGESVDGVIALDVPGLASILKVVGPVANPLTVEPIRSDNAGRILLHDFYANAPQGDQEARKERLGDVASAVIGKVTSGRHDAIALGRELATASAGGHFRLWSKDPTEERVFARTGLGGGPDSHLPDRTLHLSVQNASSNKLDYYQRQRVRVDVYVTPVGTAVVRTSLTMLNNAPRSAAPSYQLGPGGATQKRPGEYPARIYFWGPRQEPADPQLRESGLTLQYSSALIPPGDRRTVQFDVAIPRAIRHGRLALRLVPQPTLVPAALEVRLHAPDFSVRGETRVVGSWDRTMTLTWGLKS